MTRLVWGAVGDRYFEAGADRGVLFVEDKPGVPWDGLLSVNETPDGGNITGFYLDGVKYLDLSPSEEFKATIEAINAPAEFAACDGSSILLPGLFAGQQPRSKFGMTYRTLIGNDVDGLDHGSKIHIVYNATASPSSKKNLSLTDSSVNPLASSWSITTIPQVSTLFRPTAHFYADSRYTPPDVWAQLEDTLYGTEATDPYLPSLDELVTMFTPFVPETGLFTANFESSF